MFLCQPFLCAHSLSFINTAVWSTVKDSLASQLFFFFFLRNLLCTIFNLMLIPFCLVVTHVCPPLFLPRPVIEQESCLAFVFFSYTCTHPWPYLLASVLCLSISSGCLQCILLTCTLVISMLHLKACYVWMTLEFWSDIYIYRENNKYIVVFNFVPKGVHISGVLCISFSLAFSILYHTLNLMLWNRP